MKPVATATERLRDALVGVALLSFALVLWFVLIPVYASGHGEHAIVAEIAAILIGGLALVLLVLAALGIPSAAGNAGEDDPFLDTDAGREPPKLFVLGAIWGLYVAGLYFIGFHLAGLIAVGASIALLGVRRPLPLIACTLGAVLVSHIVFELGFKLTLPRGRLLEAFLYGNAF